jgi:hypothetical protein
LLGNRDDSGFMRRRVAVVTKLASRTAGAMDGSGVAGAASVTVAVSGKSSASRPTCVAVTVTPTV